MKGLHCKHCGSDVERTDPRCPRCGMPLPEHKVMAAHRKFLLFFVVLVVFALVMMLWLPPDWSGL